MTIKGRRSAFFSVQNFPNSVLTRIHFCDIITTRFAAYRLRQICFINVIYAICCITKNKKQPQLFRCLKRKTVSEFLA